MRRARLGVVLLVPAPLDKEVDGLRRALGDTSLGRIPAHLTLVPPVNVRDRAGAEAVLREAGAASCPFEVSLGPAATFWPASPVVYLAVGSGAGEVGALRERVGQGPLERRVGWPYVAHVTLVDGAAPTRIEAAVTALADWRATVSFDRVHLLEEAGDHVWEPVAEAALGRPAVVGRGGLPVELAVSERADRGLPAWAGQVPAWAGQVPAWAGQVPGEAAGGGGVPPAAGSAGARPAAAFAVTARREGEVVGLAEGLVSGVECHLHRLVVDPAQRGQGVGAHLLAAVESLAAERGCVRCRCLAALGSRGEDFLRGRGWVRTGELADWWAGEDYARLERRLAAEPGRD